MIHKSMNPSEPPSLTASINGHPYLLQSPQTSCHPRECFQVKLGPMTMSCFPYGKKEIPF